MPSCCKAYLHASILASLFLGLNQGLLYVLGPIVTAYAQPPPGPQRSSNQGFLNFMRLLYSYTADTGCLSASPRDAVIISPRVGGALPEIEGGAGGAGVDEDVSAVVEIAGTGSGKSCLLPCSLSNLIGS